MAGSPEIVPEIALLQEQRNALQAEFIQQQERTRTLKAKERQDQEELAKLRPRGAAAATARATRALADEESRLDAEAAGVAAAKADMEMHRAKAAELQQQMHAVRNSTDRRIEEALAEHESAANARLDQANAERIGEKEELDHRVRSCETQLASLHVEAAEAGQRVRRLRRRTALLRLGRAAAAWQHEVHVRGLRQKARRERAAGLRKLSREGEEIDKELTDKRETANKEVRQDELVDERTKGKYKDEVEGLREELGDVEDRIEEIEYRMRQKEALAAALNMVAIPTEGDHIKRWAQAASGPGSAPFHDAAIRLHRRTFVPGLDGAPDDAPVVKHVMKGVKGAGKRLRGTASAPSLPALQGGLQQLEDQIRARRYHP